MDEEANEMSKLEKLLIERVTITCKFRGKRRYRRFDIRPPLDTSHLAKGDHFEIRYRVTKEEGA